MLVRLVATSQRVSTSLRAIRLASTDAKDKFKVVVVGGGTAGLAVSNQISDRFKAAGKPLGSGEIAVVDGTEHHHYQPGWTLVGSGLKQKHTLRRNLPDLIPPHLTHVKSSVTSFTPEKSSVTTASGQTLSYDVLVVATGLQINWDNIVGLSKALEDRSSGVSSIYSYETCDKTWNDIENLQGGKAVFTQPAGVVKCAGAPQKIMWMAWDRFKRTGRGNKIKVDFYTGMPTMFSVKKYSDALDSLRLERGVEASFGHNLLSVDSSKKTATFKTPEGKSIETDYAFLHVTPPMSPLEIIKNSPLADAAGWVDVDEGSMQHKKSQYANVFAIGDCSSLPTSKTAAAITAQAPVLTENVFSFLENGKVSESAIYDGYTSCPLLTGYGQLMLAEFKYGLQPQETFASSYGDQAAPGRIFYHLKKDLFPWVYYNGMVQGKWFGTNAFTRPTFP